MMRNKVALLCVLIFSLSAHGADSDEVKFKSQTYKTGKEFNAKPYAEKSYTTSEKAASRSIGTPLASDQIRQPDVKPVVAKEPLNSKSLEAPPPMQLNPYVQGDKQYPSTISPNRVLENMERKPFVVTTNKVKNATFIPAEKPKEKNPLLEPRQGIKILPTEDEK